jgi:general secretion pathway protein G
MKHRQQDAFTLMEQIMVMFIIGTILAMVVGLSKYASHRADEALARADLEKYRNALTDYVAVYGHVPTKPAAMRSQLPDADPWSHPYVYVSNSPLSYTVFSTGPDGQEGTVDDVYPGQE